MSTATTVRVRTLGAAAALAALAAVAVPTAASASAPARTAASAKAAVATPRCATANLRFSVSPQAISRNQAAENVKLTNKGSRTCALLGFPGVDLKTNYGTESVPRSKKSARLVTLRPGASAVFGIDYPVNRTGGSGVRVESIVVTPPNETHSVTLAWTGGTLPVTDGSGPGLTVNPVVPAAR